MTEAETFLAAIIAQPDDDTVRLVYADWLAENGQPDRGEFIRAEIELAQSLLHEEIDERRRRVLLDRRAALLKRHKAVWLAPFLPFAREDSFERGFVQALEVPARDFLDSAGTWFEQTPLTRVKVTELHTWNPVHGRVSHTAEVLGSPLLARVTALDLDGRGLTATDLMPFAAQPDLSRLRELSLAYNGLRSEGATLLASMPQLAHLESLDLRSNGITDPGARAVALGAHFGALKELRISKNSIRNRTWAMLEERFDYALVG
ncbi:MAG: TIGR02996 domain-containing protein [Planctomycetes bacterium]|nr:TIGR02996 domain-containing protein [Planctomycetota bacterium]